MDSSPHLPGGGYPHTRLAQPWGSTVPPPRTLAFPGIPQILVWEGQQSCHPTSRATTQLPPGAGGCRDVKGVAGFGVLLVFVFFTLGYRSGDFIPQKKAKKNMEIPGSMGPKTIIRSCLVQSWLRERSFSLSSLCNASTQVKFFSVLIICTHQ